MRYREKLSIHFEKDHMDLACGRITHALVKYIENCMAVYPKSTLPLAYSQQSVLSPLNVLDVKFCSDNMEVAA